MENQHSHLLRSTLGTHVRAERLRRGITQERLAEHLGVTPRYLAAIERGERNLTLDSIEALAAQLGVDPHSLLTHPWRSLIDTELGAIAATAADHDNLSKATSSCIRETSSASTASRKSGVNTQNDPFSGPSGHFGQNKTRYPSDFSLRYRVSLVAGTGFEPATSGL